MGKETWYTFSEAGIKIGKSRYYFGNVYKKHPEYFREDFYQKSGRIWLINEEGISEIRKQVKKEGDLELATTNS